MDELLLDYDKLRNLLRSQGEALQADDQQKSAALMPLISKYTQRIHQYDDQIKFLPKPERVRLRPILQSLLEDVELNRQQWNHFYGQLEKARTQLQSARRFAQAMVPLNSTSRLRLVDQSG